MTKEETILKEFPKYQEAYENIRDILESEDMDFTMELDCVSHERSFIVWWILGNSKWKIEGIKISIPTEKILSNDIVFDCLTSDRDISKFESDGVYKRYVDVKFKHSNSTLQRIKKLTGYTIKSFGITGSNLIFHLSND